MAFDPLLFTDQNNSQINLGDTVYVTKGKQKSSSKWIFVFSIPQHRFGFMLERFYRKTVSDNEKGLLGHNRIPEPFVIDVSSLDFYWTPKSKQLIKKS